MASRNWFEILLFVVAVAASAFAFWRRFGFVYRTIRLSKPDLDFQLAPVGKRIWTFVRDVLCQEKVIQQRPLPGIAHALVFWGFCAFALVTLNHVAMGFGWEPLSRDTGFFGPLYYALAFVFSAIVTVSIVGLTVRRFVVRPKWLGEQVSVESGFIALLIVTLMVTYAADFVYHWEPDTLGAKVLWWLHTAALLIFLPLLPHTKHLHLLLSPVAVFLARDGFSRIPPLAGDEDFGLDTGKDVTQLAALQAYSCVECGRCQEHCPANNTGKELNPKLIALGFRSYLNEHGPGAEAALLGAHLSEEAVFQCTTCGACEYQCPVGVQHLPLIIGLRRGAVNTGKWEDDYGGQLFVKLERNGNPLGMSALERDRFVSKNELPIFDGSQEYCLWLGCMGSYDPQGREIVLSLVRVLRHLGVTFGVLKKEKCTGDSARRLGNDLAFQQLAEFNINQMKAAKVAKLLSICPHCVRTIGTDWKELGVEFEIEHHSEFLARHSDQLPAATGGPRVVYHDPCYLGRYQEIYEQPRHVVKGAGTLVEAGRHKERSFCCGAGGGLVFLGEEKGKRVSHERVEELVATGAEVVGAACPFCNTMFRDALSAVRPENTPKLLDIAQLAAARLPNAVSGPES